MYLEMLWKKSLREKWKKKLDSWYKNCHLDVFPRIPDGQDLPGFKPVDFALNQRDVSD